MFQKLILTVLLAFMCLTSNAYASSTDDLVASMESVCDVSIGNNLVLLEQAFAQEPYSSKWKLQANNGSSKTSLIYDPIYKDYPNGAPSDGGYDVTSRLYINANDNKSINSITYSLRYRTNGVYYSGTLNFLIKKASANFGMPQESTEKINGHVAQVKTWSVGSRVLTIKTWNETYDRYHPYWIDIIRT